MALTSERIEELANRQGVNRIAVENFLFTVDGNSSLQEALNNLEKDKQLYKWDYLTYTVIKTGIREYFKK